MNRQGGKRFKQYNSAEPTIYPIHSVVLNPVIIRGLEDSRFKEGILSLKQGNQIDSLLSYSILIIYNFLLLFLSSHISDYIEYPVGSKVVAISYYNYGQTGKIISLDKKNPGQFQVELDTPPVADTAFGQHIVSSMKSSYHSSTEVAQSLNISPLALSRITGTLNLKVIDASLLSVSLPCR